MGRTYFKCPCCMNRVWVDTSWYTLGIGSCFVGSICFACRDKHGNYNIDCFGREAKREAARREHEKQMKEMEMNHQKWLREQTEKEEKAKEKRSQARKKDCKELIEEHEKKLEKIKESLKVEKEELNKWKQDKAKTESEMKEKEDEYNRCLKHYNEELNDINGKLKPLQDEIEAAEKTLSVGEDYIGKIINALVAMSSQATRMRIHSKKATSQMRAFAEDFVERRKEDLMSKTGYVDGDGINNKVTLDEHFGKGLSEFVKVLKNEGFEDLASLKCDNEDEYDELCKDLGESLERKLKVREKKTLKAACLPAAARSMMKPIAKDENFGIVLRLMGKLFDFMDQGLSKTRKELQLGYFDENKENKENNENNESDLSIACVSSNTDNTMREMKKVVELELQSRQEKEKEQLNESGELILGFGQAAGRAFEEIMIAHCQLEREFGVTNELMRHKPANLQGASAVALWNAVTQGHLNVIERIVTLSERTNEFFGIISRLKYSCHHYLANQDKSPQLSLKYLIEDLNSFLTLSNQFTQDMDNANKQTQTCVEEIEKAKFGQIIEQTITKRDELNAKKAKLQLKQDEKEKEYAKTRAPLKLQIVQLQDVIKFSECKIGSLQQEKQQRDAYIDKLNQTLNSLVSNK